MAKHLQLKIITPERLVHEEEVEQVTIPTTDGTITVLPGHIPLVSILSKGDIIARKDGEDIPFVALGGFIRVTGNEVAIMADFALPIETVASEEAVERAKKRAAELQKQFENKEIVDFEHFESELERNLVQAHVGDKWRVRKYRK